MDANTLSTLTITLLVCTAFMAGYIDTLVGGGGLITIPALMLAGVPPIYALGPNKLQGSAGSGTPWRLFSRGRGSDVYHRRPGAVAPGHGDA